MNTIRKENSVRWYDWTLVALLAVLCALLFSSCDLLWTGNRSWLMLEGNPLTFYDRSYVWSGAHNANYMPTIFVLFALWNLPLKLLGVTAPAFEGEINLFLLQWYRVLPSLFMAGCTALVGRIALKMGMEKKKAILCTFAFITAPLIFHSLFIYGQYDTLGIFFTLLAIERWLQWEKPRNRVLFSLWMGVAITFKYFSLPVFFILLFLREKRLSRVALHTALALALLVVETALYAPSPEFQGYVLGYSTLQYLKSNTMNTFHGSAIIPLAVMFALIAWAWFVKPEDERDKISWGLFLCAGICFAFFGLSPWNPQWLAFLVPFAVLGAFRHENGATLLMLDIPLMACVYLTQWATWPWWVDEALYCGVLRNSLVVTVARRVTELLPQYDVDLFYTALIVLLGINFLALHPSKALRNPAEDAIPHAVGWMRARVLFTVLFFLVPTLYGAWYNLQVTIDDLSGSVSGYEDVGVAGEEGLRQRFRPAQDERLRSALLYMDTYDKAGLPGSMRVTLTDEATGEALAEADVPLVEIRDQSWLEVPMPCEIKADHSYVLTVAAGEGFRSTDSVTLGYATDELGDTAVCALSDGEPQQKDYAIRLIYERVPLRLADLEGDWPAP